MTRCPKWSESRRSTQPIGRAALLITLAVSSAACTPDAERPAIPLDERTPKVLLIGIDGVRADVLASVATPNLDALAAAGTYTARTLTTTPSVSGPAWSSMLTGVWPEKHGVTDNEFGGRRYEEYPDFLTRIERHDASLRTFAVVDWAPLGRLDGGSTAIGDSVDAREVLDGYELGWAEADARSVELAVAHLGDANPDALFVYLGNPDETSHATRSIGVEYEEAIALSDRHVGMLLSAVRGRPSFDEENWLVLVSTDHGRTADGGHGGDSREEMTTFLLVSGPTASVGGVDGETYIVDIVPTALTHLGIPIDPEWGLDGSAIGLR